MFIPLDREELEKETQQKQKHSPKAKFAGKITSSGTQLHNNSRGLPILSLGPKMQKQSQMISGMVV